MKQKIYDIDLRRLLLRCGVTLEQRADVDREEGMTGGLSGNLLPVGEGLAVEVGVGEEDYMVVAERAELLRRQRVQSARRHPDILGKPFGHDHRRLLRLDYRHGGSGVKEVESEKASLHGQVTVVAVVGLHPGGDPGGIALLVAVAIFTVVHDLAVADDSRLIRLPEDDTPVTATAEMVAVCRPLHLLLRQIAAPDQCPTEHCVG